MHKTITTLGLSAVLVLPTWQSATPADAASVIQFSRVYVNAPGADTSANSSVNGEYVQIRNLSSRNVALTNWTVRDAQTHVYTFGTYVLPAGKSVTLRTGKGTNGALSSYWQLSYHVWNNTGDTASLRNGAGAVQDTCAWRTVASYTSC